MSTESQDYSTDHQRARIREYAAAKGLTIIREYTDDGKSGLDIKRRKGLSNLMEDVQSGQAEFSRIIVYDVSRWGRFQDVDEAAYHEHTCRRAGIQVVYCGERFSDDTSPYTTLLKGMKRVMAAEYSRELSEKVFIAQCRFIEKGFKQGGHAGYGLRRLALTAKGAPRSILEYGEAKGCITDRVVLVLGPAHEVATVRRVYGLYVDSKASEAAIAHQLNEEEVASETGRPWTHSMVNSLLTNIKYCGTLAYNRGSCKLSSPRIHNSRDEWVVKRDAIAPIVSAERFAEAQLERKRRNRRYSPEELLELLRICHNTHGKVTASIIASDPTMPDPQLFVRAFGSLVRAYDSAGIPQLHSLVFVTTKSRLLKQQKKIFSQVRDLAAKAGADVHESTRPFTLILNDGLRVRVEVAVCRRPKRGSPCWRMPPRKDVNFVISARIDPITYEPLDYFLVSAKELASGPLYLKESNLERYEALRFDTLTEMFCST